jgi:hypothetical protein
MFTSTHNRTVLTYRIRINPSVLLHIVTFPVFHLSALIDHHSHGLINYTDIKSKRSSFKKIELQLDFAADVYLSEPLRPLPLLWGFDTIHPLTYTLYTCILYTYTHRKGGERWRIETERRL